MLAGGPSVLLLFTVILSLGNLEKFFFPSIIFILNGFLKPSTVCAPGATPKRETWGPWGRLRFVFHKGQEKWHNPLFDSFLSVYVQSRRNGFTLPFNSLESPSASALLRFLIFLPTPLNQSGVADCANGSEQGRQRTKSHNIFPQWQLKKKKKKDSIEMPSVIPSPEVQWLSECHCQCLWDDPACFHSSKPPLAQRWKAWRGGYFKCSITAPSEGCQEGKKSAKVPAYVLCVSPRKKKKTCKVEDPFLRNRFVCIDVGIGRLLSAWPSHTSSYLLLCLMALHQNV